MRSAGLAGARMLVATANAELTQHYSDSCSGLTRALQSDLCPKIPGRIHARCARFPRHSLALSA